MHFKDEIMKKGVYLIGLLLLLLLLNGCNERRVRPNTSPKPAPSPFYRHLEDGERAEAQKDLAQALDHYKQALIAAPQDSEHQVKAHKRVKRVERKINLAIKRCQAYKSLLKQGKHAQAQKMLARVRQIWPYYKGCQAAPTQPPRAFETPDVGSYQIIDERPLIHKIRAGDIISKLCQKYYGRTENYKLVHIIMHYNQINSKNLHAGQKIKFPTIRLNGKTYRPNGASPPRPEPVITLAPRPQPTPPSAPTIAPEPTPEHKNYYNQATALFRAGRYADAVAMLDKVPRNSPHKREALIISGQCHFRIAQMAKQQKQFRQAKESYSQAWLLCQRLQGVDWPYPCDQLDGLISECQAELKTEAMQEYFEKGQQLLKANRLDPAIEAFEKVLELDPLNKDALEYLYLLHFKKAARLRQRKAYRRALEEFMTAWEYNQNCAECQKSINRIKGVLYGKAKALEKKLLEPNTPIIPILEEQIQYYGIINQLDPSYEDVAERLEKARVRKQYLEDRTLQPTQ